MDLAEDRTQPSINELRFRAQGWCYVTAADIAEALQARALSTGGWIAKCPAHDDTNPSMSLAEGDHGLVVHCHAGCVQGDVIDALRHRGLWPRNDEIPTSHFQLGPYTEHWDYQDAIAAHVMRVCRWETSSGKTIRPLSLQGGRWVWKSFERDRPLYRLSQLKDLSRRVVVVEGEKTAEAAVKLFGEQFTVTTWSGGAKAVRKTDWKSLAGRDVTLIADNDEPGHKAMDSVAAILAANDCKVRRADISVLGPLPEGWDIADALGDKNLDLDALWSVVRNAAIAPATSCTQTEATTADELAAVTRCMRDIQPEPISWLWPGRIARGKVTLIAGDPGLGKSQLTAALASCVSIGGQWPVDRASAPLGNILILNAEDDAADTIRPRLDAAGANVGNVYILDSIRAVDHEGMPTRRSFDLARDIAALAVAARRIGNIALIVIDPISAYLGGTDSHRNADIRGLLAPLASTASTLNAAIVAVSHLNKSSGSDALMRVTGSLAFVAAARAAFLVVKDAQEPARRLFVSAKNNIGPDQGNGLAFRVTPVMLHNGIATSRLEWEAEPVAISANEALAALSEDAEKGSALADAKRFLCDVLANGPLSADDVKGLAKEHGHAMATVRRAKDALDVVVDKDGFRRGWRWSLPSKMLKNIEDAQAKTLSTFDNDEHLRQLAGNDSGLTEVEL